MTAPQFHHEALFYDGDDEFVAGCSAFAEEGQALPGVQVPDTGVPPVDGATGGVQDLADGLQNSLP